MLRITLLSFGKLRTPGLRDSADHYLKLIRPWVPELEEIELKPVPIPNKSEALRLKIQAQEGQMLLDRIRPRLEGGGALYLLDEKGRARPTLEWADLIRGWESTGLRELILCVGGSLGFSPEVRGKARGLLSLGPQTLPHELARVVLLEQLYRAWSVTRAHPYHNEGS